MVLAGCFHALQQAPIPGWLAGRIVKETGRMTEHTTHHSTKAHLLVLMANASLTKVNFDGTHMSVLGLFATSSKMSEKWQLCGYSFVVKAVQALFFSTLDLGKKSMRTNTNNRKHMREHWKYLITQNCLVCVFMFLHLSKQVALKLNFKPAFTPHISIAADSIIDHAFRKQRAPPNRSKHDHDPEW